jgi:8-oxo-dGTP diphosphatase
MPKISQEPIFIGCELIVRQDDKVLLGLRKNCYGAGTWALPGGHLEFGERLIAAACREAMEELGATVRPGELRLVSLVDHVRPGETEQHVHVSFELRDPAWEPQVMEPDQCEEWRYFPLDALPDNFFPPHEGIVANYLLQQLYAS